MFVGLSACSFVFSKWKACSVGLRSGDALVIEEYSTSLPQESLGLLLWYVLGHYPSTLCTAISFAAFGWVWAEIVALYTSEFILILLSAVITSINTSDRIPLAAMHSLAITTSMVHHVWQMMWSWTVPFILHTFLFPSFCYKLILVFIHSKNPSLLVLEWYQWFGPCCKPII